MEENNRTRKPILESILFISELSKKSTLSNDLFLKLEVPLKETSDYFSLTTIQALLLASIIHYNYKRGTAGIDDLADYFDCTIVQIMRFKEDFDELVKKGILLKEKKTVTRNIYRAPCVDTFYVPDNIFQAVINNEPMPDISQTKCKDVFDLLEKLYDLGVERDNEIISTRDLLNRSMDLISAYAEFLLVKKILLIDLSAEDVYMLCYLLWKYVNGVQKVDLETAVKGIFDCSRTRFDYRKDLLLGYHPLIQNNLVELEKSWYQVDHNIKLKDNAVRLLVSDDLQMLVKKQKMDNIIIPSEITSKKLVFNQRETEQINQLGQSLQEEKFKEIQDRLKQKGLPTGFTVLLFGSPGTGKTESVYQLARETSREIMFVDLSKSKSCWFGESEKLVKQIFTDYSIYTKECKTTPILFFNEADGLFSKRKDIGTSSVAQTENTIQNIILQELETFSGILVATTNLVSNFDKAFERRFLYKIGLSKPDISARSQIWETKLPGLPESDYTILGERFDFSGGQIDNVVRKHEISGILAGRNPDLTELIVFCNEELLDKSNYSKIGFTISKE